MGEIATSLERGAHLVGAYLEPTIGGLRLTQGEAHVLAQLERRGAISIAVLHHDFGHKRSTLTNILDRLEKRKLVRREANPSDRRSLVVRLTGTGKRTARQVTAALDKLEHRLGAELSTSEVAGVERAISALDSIVRAKVPKQA